MSGLEFRSALFGYIVLACTDVYFRAAPSDSRFEWLRRLSRWQSVLFIAASVSTLLAVGVGILGMFLFLTWGAVIFTVGALVAEIGNAVLFRGGTRTRLASAVNYLLPTYEASLVYLVFFGPAKQLFQ